MTRWAEVVGQPIAHSRSPAIHRFWLESLGLEGDYRATDVGKGSLGAHLETCRDDPDWRGSNVTMPLKLEALLLADRPGDLAVAAGAANILGLRDGEIVADNSDVLAIRTLVARLAKAGRAMDAVTILGSGGAARAALAALRSLGLSEVRLMARDRRAAERLHDEFGLETEAVGLDTPIEGSAMINATPIGMAGGPTRDLDLGGLDGKGWLLDMVSVPAETALLRAARARGLATIGGLDMLVEQADASFRFFFGAAPPREKDAMLRERLGR